MVQSSRASSPRRCLGYPPQCSVLRAFFQGFLGLREANAIQDSAIVEQSFDVYYSPTSVASVVLEYFPARPINVKLLNSKRKAS